MKRALGWSIAAIAWAMLIAAIAWYPFTWRSSPDLTAWCWLGCGDRWLADVLQNMVLFAPLGAALGRRGLAARETLLAATALSLGIELVQAWLPRDPTAQDVVANAAGAVLGRALLGGRERSPRRSLVFGGTIVIAIAMLGGWTARFSGWTVAYPVHWGDEPDGSRPWSGSVTAALWCDADDRCAALTPGSSTPPGLVREALDRQRLDLRLHLAVPPNDEHGPARIVTSSTGPDRRNFTVAQQGRDLVVRLRSLCTGLNGGRPALRLGGGLRVARQDTVRVRVTASGGRVELSSSVIDVGEARFAFGPWSAWLLLAPLRVIAPAALVVGSAVSVVLALALLGWLAARAELSAPWTAVVGAAAALAVLWWIPALWGLAGAPPLYWGVGLLGYGLAWLARVSVGRVRTDPPTVA